ncbi:hypothetical protein E3E12_05635 [Formicincola oecophyllae]|uniref:Uncharacterized protein n=1 Tax=Formicincola oecophyllae TaxID=2558361 RepID=A0A4Y6U8Q7_9PROT|nr:hypothetical protein [Formicincola oecophyllae]QDH13752.1 hypothetical protein E3E12_05635 [Formicincola oecophyllae]
MMAQPHKLLEWATAALGAPAGHVSAPGLVALGAVLVLLCWALALLLCWRGRLRARSALQQALR